ncbi:RrF2 family transcriptional regulator [Candidatus Omnitrophota bacterium]
MKLITRDTDYAVRALCYIAKSEERRISVTDLVKELKIPRAFLRKILQILNKKELLISHKGQGGGFTLGKKAKGIFLVDLIRIFQGRLKLNECFLKKSICPNIKVCPLKREIDNVEQYVTKRLKSITIASLLHK